MIYSGLDWSGSPGLKHGPTIVFSVVHIDSDNIPTLDTALEGVKQRLHLPLDYVFSHNGSGRRTQEEFFAAIARLPLTSHAYILDKKAWAAQHVGKPTGQRCLCYGIAQVVQGCPDPVIAQQVLYIDWKDRDAAMREYRTAIHDVLKAARPRRTGFGSVRPCPDHRLQGGIIQVADMIGGEIREHGERSGPHLPKLGFPICLV